MGQIKNIKLHIVTDIKIKHRFPLIIKMSSDGPKVINYTGGVVKASGEKGAFLDKVNMIAERQQLMQGSAKYVHEKTPQCVRNLRGGYYGSFVVLGLSLFSLGLFMRK